ncbi:hypothetical protein [Streptomyces sp. NPDC058335]|uniref:hypothetical protein n=1 Tax=Streptomyces sp. NPDC058335 TaxID=3346451 RepID=UPI00365EE674
MTTLSDGYRTGLVRRRVLELYEAILTEHRHERAVRELRSVLAVCEPGHGSNRCAATCGGQHRSRTPDPGFRGKPGRNAPSVALRWLVRVVCNEARQVPEAEQRLRETVTKLRKTIAAQRTELEELRQFVTSLTVANAVLTHQHRTAAQPAPVPDNVVPLHPPGT